MLTLLHSCGRGLLSARTHQNLRKSYYSAQMAKRVAVVLAGCGVYDGSEIHEASAVLVHLSRGGATVSEGASLGLRVTGGQEERHIVSISSYEAFSCAVF